MSLPDLYGSNRGKPLPGALERAARIVAMEADAVAFARIRLGFEADETQAAVLRSGAKRGILNCSRQWGKSTVGSLMAVHRPYTRPGSLVVVASPTQRQSGLLVAKAADWVRGLGIRVRGDGTNECSLLFPNRSRIVGLPGMEGTVRGFSKVSLMLVDEASRVSDEIYHALRPMLGVGDGDLWLMSTQFRKRGFFYDAWEFGGPDWYRVKAPVTECGRISERFIEEERTELMEDIFRREYLCEFQDDGSEVFERELLSEAWDGDIRQLEV